jgi:AGZA family xanthine/uracil permease-like MFS transporter
MLASARHIAYDDMTELVPAFATIALLVFTYNIANGLTAGLALHPIVKVAAGRGREVRPGAWVLAAMSFLYYGFGIPH